MTDFRILARAVIETEITALQQLPEHLDEQFNQACTLILECRGRVIVTGMGKSGHIGNKIAATLASTGTPAFFVHPGEASHGDLGMILPGDIVIALSNSGTSDEILTIVPMIRRLQVPIIAITSNPESALAQAATCHLNIGIHKEACPLGLAPTSSTTATLVLGDALAVALLQVRGFTANDFARSHPAGRLGKRLLIHVRDLMQQGKAIPKVPPHADLSSAILAITKQGLGLTTIVTPDDTLLGVFTDGDLRRTFAKGIDWFSKPIHTLMTTPCQTIGADELAVEALNTMQQYSITALPVVDNQRVIGIIHMHDLLKAGIA
ncbi:KpsF/GutQ family sugar-phosphate isomerase [Thiofilum flexile]|uniref:KpsF/GutQ family sugar-phosphate isomerase n=1 Tax=Thiofilum flexile TaxID=125627 RepID=UPI0003620A6E|nr:KpsF/GutQ family sugar-phosphate isomerase [Thiofilum flexile]